MTSDRPRTYAEHAVDYAQAGWPCVLPVPAATKTPPPVGFTGDQGSDSDALQIATWVGQFPEHSIALRMPGGVIGIDVDQYDKVSRTGEVVHKRGAETIAACIERWGPLPPTWTSTARGPGPSRINFYRVPDQRYVTVLRGPETADVEVIQRHHRYAVVAPSWHHDAGAPYAWCDPEGAPSHLPPSPGELPWLPQAWVDGLAEGASAASAVPSSRSDGQALLDELRDDVRPECAEIGSIRLQALDQLKTADAGSRHDTMTGKVYALVMTAAGGHPGVGTALAELEALWSDLTAGEAREEEFGRMLLTAARKAVTEIGARQVPSDPCLLVGLTAYPAPAPSYDVAPDPSIDPADLEPIEAPRWSSMRSHIGAEPFDPQADLDQDLAESVLERVYPVLRYAYDSQGWVLRAPLSWEAHTGRSGLADWAVSQVAQLMPVGNPEADKGTPEQRRAARRVRLKTAAGAKAVATKMSALVAGGMHPASLRLAKLDSEPEILWAGGVAWDLRRSAEGPAVAPGVDPAAPHLHSAAVAPDVRPTPLWDAFLAAVWPDPELRAWALRVLSIGLTGYADRAMPILLGETGRGKTQVVQLLMSVLGDYAHAADPRLMSPAGENAHQSIVYALKGKRWSFIDEGPREGRMAQERLKQLTGAGTLTANQMNQNPISFDPTHTLVLTTNDDPPLVDPAVRSRARIIPCNGDPELVKASRAALGHVSGRTWRAEAPGVLAAMMGQAGLWLGDPSTAAVTAAPDNVRWLAERMGAEQDPVRVWVEEETEPSEAGTPSRVLYQEFTETCRRNNLRRDQVPTETKWGTALNRLGYPSHHTAQGKVRLLRIRRAGFSVTPPISGNGHTVLPETGANPANGMTGYDGLMTGWEGNPSTTNAQVNPPVSLIPDGLTGHSPSTHVHAHAGAHAGSYPEANPSDPSANSRTGRVTSENAADGSAPEPVINPSSTRQAPETSDPALFDAPAPKKARKPRTPKTPEQAEADRLSRAEKAAHRRALAVAALSGRHVTLPAVVTRDGAVHDCSLDDAAQLLRPVRELTVDVEHSGYPIGHQHYALRLVQLGDETFCVVLDPDDDSHQALIRRVVADAEILHAHSATADVIPLEVAGLLERGIDEAWARMDDTAIRAKLADPESVDNADGDGLKKLSTAMLGDYGLSKQADEQRAAMFKAGGWLTNTDVTTEPERSGWGQVDTTSEAFVRYGAADVLDDAAIARRLPTFSPELMLRERTTQRMTARVAHQGLRLDPETVERLHAEQTALQEQHADRVCAFGGIDNPGSNTQVAARMIELGAQLPRSDKGAPSVAKDVLEPLRSHDSDAGRLADAVLDHRKTVNRLGLFLNPYRELVRNGDGRARPTVYTLGADTGRMSCVRPNLQQVPRAGGFRSCITADPGELLISADFSGVELRVAAALSGDMALLAIVNDPERDTHWEIARMVWGPDATKAHRYLAKRMVFGRIYGSGVNGLAVTNGIDHVTAKRVADALDTIAPGLAAWSRSMRNGVDAGALTFPAYSGRIIHLPKRAAHAASNYAIQGTARELLVDALMRWSGTEWGTCRLLPVHDELVVAVPEQDADRATTVLVECMATTLGAAHIVAEPSAPSYAWADSE